MTRPLCVPFSSVKLQVKLYKSMGVAELFFGWRVPCDTFWWPPADMTNDF